MRLFLISPYYRPPSQESGPFFVEKALLFYKNRGIIPRLNSMDGAVNTIWFRKIPSLLCRQPLLRKGPGRLAVQSRPPQRAASPLREEVSIAAMQGGGRSRRRRLEGPRLNNMSGAAAFFPPNRAARWDLIRPRYYFAPQNIDSRHSARPALQGPAWSCHM